MPTVVMIKISLKGAKVEPSAVIVRFRPVSNCKPCTMVLKLGSLPNAKSLKKHIHWHDIIPKSIVPVGEAVLLSCHFRSICLNIVQMTLQTFSSSFLSTNALQL